MKRRPLLFSLFAAGLPGVSAAAQRKSMGDPLLLGVETALVESGLATQLVKAFGGDTGVAVKLAPGTSASVLAALEQGEVDASLTNAPEIEARLEKQGLAHDRRSVARGDFVLVGPIEGKGQRARDPAGLRGGHDIATALTALAQAQAKFVAPVDGSAAHLAELAMWRAAKVAPGGAWYLKTPPAGDPLAMAASQAAYTVVERSVWLKRATKSLSIIVDADPRMVTQVNAMRSFRVNHPAAKLFNQWISGPQGQRVASGVRGWQGGS